MTEKVVPAPSSLPTSIQPRACSIVPYTVARPIPVPRSPLVLKNGSKIRSRTAGGMPAPVSVTDSRT